MRISKRALVTVVAAAVAALSMAFAAGAFGAAGRSHRSNHNHHGRATALRCSTSRWRRRSRPIPPSTASPPGEAPWG
jgi:Ni/Co efflux regulator RcnB